LRRRAGVIPSERSESRDPLRIWRGIPPLASLGRDDTRKRILAAALALLLLAAVTRAMSPEELVRRSEVIVRATALGYFRPPTLPRVGRGPIFPNDTLNYRGVIRFRVEEVIKGKFKGDIIEVEGRLVHDDDFNESEVPYRTARKSPDDYNAHGEYLLMLRQAGREYNVWWAVPSASNEQIHGANDPWVRWVTAQVAKESH